MKYGEKVLQNALDALVRVREALAALEKAR